MPDALTIGHTPICLTVVSCHVTSGAVSLSPTLSVFINTAEYARMVCLSFLVSFRRMRLRITLVAIIYALDITRNL
jgi:hypothetical protein